MGALFLAGYVCFIGVATFLMKYVSKTYSAYQINLLMAIAMLVIGAPAVWLADHSFSLPRERMPLAALVAILMAAGSIFFVLAVTKLPVGLASAVASSYVVLVALLSWIVLHERMSPLKVVGIVLTLAGVAILSYAG